MLKRLKNLFSDFYLVFELWNKNSNLIKMIKKNVPEDEQCFEMYLCILWTVVRFLIFDGTYTNSEKKIVLGALSSDPIVLNPPSQLVIGYHWLAFLNQVRKNFLVSSSLQMLITKSTISQKLKIAKKKTQ